MNPQSKVEVLNTINELQQDLAKLETIYQNILRLSEEIASLHEKANKSVERCAKSMSAGVAKQSEVADTIRQMQETQISFNLQYLQLQSQMQHENRAYTAVSNIMKTKHDTVKNSISNIR